MPYLVAAHLSQLLSCLGVWQHQCYFKSQTVIVCNLFAVPLTESNHHHISSTPDITVRWDSSHCSLLDRFLRLAVFVCFPPLPPTPCNLNYNKFSL